MDDSCFCISASTSDALERKAAHLCGLLLQRCVSYAMTPNLGPGKTAAMLVFQGKGAHRARAKYFGPRADRGLPVLLEGRTQFLPVVAAYTHLGCLLHHRGDMRQEARRRYSIATSAFQQHRKVLYQNRQLGLSRRCELFHTMILSKYVYGCDSWTLHDRRSKHFVHTSLMRLFRRLLPTRPDLHLGDDEVLHQT